MKTRVEPCASVLSLAFKIDETVKEYLGSDIKEVSGDFAYIPQRLDHMYVLKNGHLIRVSVEEYI